MNETDFNKDPMKLREHATIAAIFAALEDKAKFRVDQSLIDEIVAAVSVAKEFRDKADKLRLPKRYQTEDDLHKLAAFLAEAQAKRDRVIEIKVEHMPLRVSLTKLWDRALGTMYQYDSIAKMTPAPKRDAMINFILEPLRERMAAVDMIIEAAAEADRNLGNAYFTLKELKAIGTIYLEAKRAQRGV